jgi:ABC-type lipoprotein release transport system permease subunit
MAQLAVPLAIGMTVAGGVTQAVGSVMAGREAAMSSEFEKQQLEIQAQTAHIAADQAETKRRTELTSNLETIQAIRAGRGVGSSSPTGQAILTSGIDQQERDIATERFNYLQKADLSQRASELAGRKARTSLLAGYLGAASDILSAGSKAASIYGYPNAKAAG